MRTRPPATRSAAAVMMHDSAAAAIAAVLVCCCCCCYASALSELQPVALDGDAVRLGETWGQTRGDHGRAVSVEARARTTVERTKRAPDNAALSIVAGGGGDGISSRPSRVRASAATLPAVMRDDLAAFAAASGRPPRATSRRTPVALTVRVRRSSGGRPSPHDLRDALVGGGGGWGPSVQDLRDTIVPRLRQLELTMDRATFLVLWHLISNNVHGSWEDASARYGGGGDDSIATTAAQKKRPCVRNNACLNGGKCYYETEDSKVWSCSCPHGFWGRRCQHSSKYAKEDGERGLAVQSHSSYASWSTSWTSRQK